MAETEISDLKINTSKPFTCLICGNTFESKDVLNAHKTKEHDFKIISTHRITSQVIRRYLEPVPKDPEFENLCKGSPGYKAVERRNICILCFKQATQILCLEYDDGCTNFELYCDTHASELGIT